jgi:hypothetical protein
VLSRVHWVRSEMVVEVSYVEWTPDGLLRHVVYLGEREGRLSTCGEIDLADRLDQGGVVVLHVADALSRRAEEIADGGRNGKQPGVFAAKPNDLQAKRQTFRREQR